MTPAWTRAATSKSSSLPVARRAFEIAAWSSRGGLEDRSTVKAVAANQPSSETPKGRVAKPSGAYRGSSTERPRQGRVGPTGVNRPNDPARPSGALPGHRPNDPAKAEWGPTGSSTERPRQGRVGAYRVIDRTTPPRPSGPTGVNRPNDPAKAEWGPTGSSTERPPPNAKWGLPGHRPNDPAKAEWGLPGSSTDQPWTRSENPEAERLDDEAETRRRTTHVGRRGEGSSTPTRRSTATRTTRRRSRLEGGRHRVQGHLDAERCGPRMARRDRGPRAQGLRRHRQRRDRPRQEHEELPDHDGGQAARWPTNWGSAASYRCWVGTSGGSASKPSSRVDTDERKLLKPG